MRMNPILERFQQLYKLKFNIAKPWSWPGELYVLKKFFYLSLHAHEKCIHAKREREREGGGGGRTTSEGKKVSKQR